VAGAAVTDDEVMSTDNPSGGGTGAGGAGTPSPDPGPAFELPPVHLLRRSRGDRKFAGVCGGLGRWTNVDPVIYRIGFVVAAFFGGLGLIAYGVLWLVVPVEDETTAMWQQGSAGRGDPSIAWPILAIIAGVTVGGSWAWAGPGPSWVLVVATIVVGAVLLQRSRGGAAAFAASPPGAAPENSSSASSGAPSSGYSSSGYSSSGYGASAGYGSSSGYGPTEPIPPYGASPPPPPARRERSILGGLTVSVALIAVGLLISWGFWVDDPVDAQTAVSVGLAVVGLGLLVGALVGRSRGLIVLGVILSLVVLTAGLSDLTFRGGVGERDWHPTSVATIASPYELSVGEGRLDLTDVAPAAGDTVEVSARIGIGELTVLVPDDVTVEVRAHAGTGTIKLPDGEHGGVIEAEGPSRATFILDLRTGIGDVVVRHA
jgi:phage shock protein PspC (stress-responsive transcriptional regulator)